MIDPVELHRRRERLKSAGEWVKTTADDISQTQLAFSSERTQYFEKLAIGSGAALAALVSFLGVHAKDLNPPWLMRTALALLALSMVSALYRNFRYPYYVLAIKDLSWVHAKVQEQDCKKECFEIEPDAIAWQTGERIDGEKWIKEANAEKTRIGEAIEKKERRHKRLLREFTYAEAVCLTALSTAMISLVWLAMRNF